MERWDTTAQHLLARAERAESALAEVRGRVCGTCVHKTNLNARHYCAKHSLYCTVLGKTCGAWQERSSHD